MNYSFIVCKERIVMKLVEDESCLFRTDKILNLFKLKGKKLSLRKKVRKYRKQ